MRTPREILLKRHQAAEAKLDAIREQVERGHLVRESAEHCDTTENKMVIETRGQDVRAPMLERLAESCREFFNLPRGAWAGLAAAWVVIIALNVASSETSVSPSAVAATKTQRSPEMLQALREQKRLFAELVGSASETIDADARRFVPRPRSEASPQTSIA